MTTQSLRKYRATLVQCAKRELDKATLYPRGSFLHECHIRSASQLVDSARRLTRNMRGKPL